MASGRGRLKPHYKLKMTLSDMGDLRGVTISAVRRAVQRGILDPYNPLSVFQYCFRVDLSKRFDK